MPPLHIVPTSQNTRLMVQSSGPGLKSGPRAVVARHRARYNGEKRLTSIWWGLSALILRKSPKTGWVLWLNQDISLPKAGKCFKIVAFGDINAVWWHKIFWNEGKRHSKIRAIQHNKFGFYDIFDPLKMMLGKISVRKTQGNRNWQSHRPNGTMTPPLGLKQRYLNKNVAAESIVILLLLFWRW